MLNVPTLFSKAWLQKNPLTEYKEAYAHYKEGDIKKLNIKVATIALKIFSLATLYLTALQLLIAFKAASVTSLLLSGVFYTTSYDLLKIADNLNNRSVMQMLNPMPRAIFEGAVKGTCLIEPLYKFAKKD